MTKETLVDKGKRFVGSCVREIKSLNYELQYAQPGGAILRAARASELLYGGKKKAFEITQDDLNKAREIELKENTR